MGGIWQREEKGSKAESNIIEICAQKVVSWLRFSLTIVVAVAVVVAAVSLDCHLDRLCMGLDGTGGKYEQDYRLISLINSQVGVIVLRALPAKSMDAGNW